jgi:GNAT superfamily N-acetyltransferase
MCVTVRTATRDDSHAIARVHVRSWQVAYRGLVPDSILNGLSVEQRRTIWHQLLANNDGVFTLVAERNTELVGFCSIATPSRDGDATEETCEVTAIYVAPSAWRAGIGRALLGTALDEVRQNGWREVTLWVFAANVGARAFYDGFGFGPDGAETLHQPSGQTETRLRAPL